MLRLRLLLVLLASSVIVEQSASAATACVWKVTAPDGKIAFLGGSVHALRSSDYPLPAAYVQAFNASSDIAFEVDAKALTASSNALVRNGRYPPGDTLKKHVDPRTYAYISRVFGLMGIPEKTYAQFRPWFIVLLLQSGASRHSAPVAGVDEFLMKRAAKRGMPVVGLESVEEHARVYSGLTDREGELLLLTTFIPTSGSSEELMSAWRRGDADRLAAMMERENAEFPAFGERLITARNRAWVPKIEKFIASGRTWFVVAGAGHFGGRNGVVALLRGRGYRVEQL